MAFDGKESDNGVVEFQFYRPENRSKWENIQKAIYDKPSGQCFGRTPKNWGQLLGFYMIFYIVLIALFAICMQGLFFTLSEKEPRWKLDDSLIGMNPGLGFKPISPKTEEGSLIWYNITDPSTITKWVKLMDEFLKPYKTNQTGENFVNCDFGKLPKSDEVCVVPIQQLGRCNPDRHYGYHSSSPCVFLKLNRIFDWEPEFYNSSVESMPDDLKYHIDNATKSHDDRKQIWVTCNGIDDFDKENAKEFNYYPRGFAGYYYPYKHVKNYLSPIVAVEIVNITPNVLVSIECRAWARNIFYEGGSLKKSGSVTFEIQVDSDYKLPENNVTLYKTEVK
nr:sodium/potassium-transporting ATPase subunit beta-1-like [Leptinotarsa decemlineata]